MGNYIGLPLDTSDKEVALMVEVALDWVEENTTLEFDREKELPANVKLFTVKFCDLMSQSVGVASESLGGMSQSFVSSSTSALVLRDLATQIFGKAYKGRNRFIAASRKWK